MEEHVKREFLTAETLLDLEQVGDLHFRNRYNQDNHVGAIYGGQAISQALAACQRTTPWAPHNLSCMFLRGGDPKIAVEYHVEILRDGRRYASRRVLASQNGKAIFDMLCSFHDPEEGFQHQMGGIEGVPGPEGLLTVPEFVRANKHRLPPDSHGYDRPFPVEYSLTDSEERFFSAEQDPELSFWFRMPTAAPLVDDRDHRCVLAFMSDYWLAGAARLRHWTYQDPRAGIFIASLNHSMWFHGPVRADDWMLYRCDSPWAGEGRALARGLIYDRGGKLLASTAQEISMRLITPQK